MLSKRCSMWEPSQPTLGGETRTRPIHLAASLHYSEIRELLFSLTLQQQRDVQVNMLSNSEGIARCFKLNFFSRMPSTALAPPLLQPPCYSRFKREAHLGSQIGSHQK